MIGSDNMWSLCVDCQYCSFEIEPVVEEGIFYVAQCCRHFLQHHTAETLKTENNVAIEDCFFDGSFCGSFSHNKPSFIHTWERKLNNDQL